MVIINQALCTGCGLCTADCVAGNLKIEDQKSVPKGRCIFCGHCVAICPAGAVSIPGYEMDEVEEYDKDSFELSPENFLHAVKFRRSVRDYQNRKIEPEKIKSIASAGVYTETAVNSQGVRFILVQDELDKLKRLAWEGWLNYAEQTEQPASPSPEYIKKCYARMKENPEQDRLFFNAPAVVIVASRVPLDGGLAAANMEMMAVAEGLGMLFNGYLLRALNHSEEALEWLGLNEIPMASCMLLGYPAVTYRRTAPRRKGNIVLL